MEVANVRVWGANRCTNLSLPARDVGGSKGSAFTDVRSSTIYSKLAAVPFASGATINSKSLVRNSVVVIAPHAEREQWSPAADVEHKRNAYERPWEGIESNGPVWIPLNRLMPTPFLTETPANYSLERGWVWAGDFGPIEAKGTLPTTSLCFRRKYASTAALSWLIVVLGMEAFNVGKFIEMYEVKGGSADEFMRCSRHRHQGQLGCQIWLQRQCLGELTEQLNQARYFDVPHPRARSVRATSPWTPPQLPRGRVLHLHLQSQIHYHRATTKEWAWSLSSQTGVICSITRSIVSSSGVLGIWRGTSTSLIHNVPGIALYFTSSNASSS
ncbi:hypothetical protein BGY98DRAFT_1176256 [Russula aff. rugulosa BPL654]|nr:hypothetical protein BGY98DRAFT_1176256 [Russula aff. rugulosa BPL654]